MTEYDNNLIPVSLYPTGGGPGRHRTESNMASTWKCTRHLCAKNHKTRTRTCLPAGQKPVFLVISTMNGIVFVDYSVLAHPMHNPFPRMSNTSLESHCPIPLLFPIGGIHH